MILKIYYKYDIIYNELKEKYKIINIIIWTKNISYNVL